MQKGFSAKRETGFAPILIVLLIAAVVGIGGYFIYTNHSAKPAELASQQSVIDSQTPQITPTPSIQNTNTLTIETLQGNKFSANDNMLINNTMQLRASLEQYKHDEGSYPSSLQEVNTYSGLTVNQLSQYSYGKTGDLYIMSIKLGTGQTFEVHPSISK